MSDSCSGSLEAEKMIYKMNSLREQVLSELRTSSEELCARDSDFDRMKTDVKTIREQLKAAEQNNGTLTSSLAKLKSKQETHRARASGAV